VVVWELIGGRAVSGGFVLRPREKHKNGAEWVFWAEVPGADAGD
jgi:hypothetical protein